MRDAEASCQLELMTDLTAADWLAKHLSDGRPRRKPSWSVPWYRGDSTRTRGCSSLRMTPAAGRCGGRMSRPPQDGRSTVRWSGNASSSRSRDSSTALPCGRNTPEVCWFCVWIGYGDIPERLWEWPQVRLPGREYVLLRGPLDAVTSSTFERIDLQAPNIWWPDDRRWCVATENDLMSTYVGGSQRASTPWSIPPTRPSRPGRTRAWITSPTG
jgi:hypothetical protein